MNGTIQNRISLQQLVRDGLNQRVASLDGASLSRLNQSRQAALAQLQPRPHWFSCWLNRWLNRYGAEVWGPAVLASVLLALLLLPLQLQSPGAEPLPSDAVILALDEGYDYIDELEFGLWLDQAALAAAMPE
ncbi:MAG: hypothetical protein HQL47_04345 [Gammaproteobacteria bacterium]|nr:hypothetical protein [Gammaproteobacteria bacterium]